MTQTQGLDSSLVPWEAQEVDRWLREGHPTLGWRGDPRLNLQLSALLATKFGYDDRAKRILRKGDVAALCWEVTRHTELGKDERILQAPINKLTEIIPRLIKLDPRTPDFETTMDVVEREDEQVQKEKSYAIQQAHGENAEHLWHLVHDKTNGPSTFRGMPGRNPDRQL